MGCKHNWKVVSRPSGESGTRRILRFSVSIPPCNTRVMTLPAAFEILACPGCYYERMMPTWVFFASLRLLVVLGVSYGRLDLVRTLGVFVAFEVFFLYAWRLSIWYSFPMVNGDMVRTLAGYCSLILSAGIPAALLLFGLSRVRYFRGTQTIPFTRRRAALLLPLMFMLATLQGL